MTSKTKVPGIMAVAALGAALGVGIITSTAVKVIVSDAPGAPAQTAKLVMPQPRAELAMRVASTEPVESGTLWQWVDAGASPRRPPVPVAKAANYVQGPSLIQHPNGAWSLLANAGYCCDVPLPWGPGYEGLVRLSVPGAWEWIAAPNDWGANPGLDEHELAFPAYLGGRIAYTATRWSQHAQPHQGRVGVGLATGTWAGGWQRAPGWLEADGTVAHWSVALMTDPAGRTWLYTRESGEGLRNVRREVMVDGTLGPRQTTTWASAPATWHPSITDMVRGSDGAWYALEEVPEPGADVWAWRELAEWQSVAMPMAGVDVGVAWQRTGRRIRPGSRTLWDGGYARTEAGDRASGIIVGLCGTGLGAETGDWELCVWQPTGVALPPSLVPYLAPVSTSTPTPTPAAQPTATPTPRPTPSPATAGTLTWDVREDSTRGVQVHIWVYASPDPVRSPAVIDFGDGRIMACAAGGPACRVVGVTPSDWPGGWYSTRVRVTNAEWALVQVTGPGPAVLPPLEVAP